MKKLTDREKIEVFVKKVCKKYPIMKNKRVQLGDCFWIWLNGTYASLNLETVDLKVSLSLHNDSISVSTSRINFDEVVVEEILEAMEKEIDKNLLKNLEKETEKEIKELEEKLKSLKVK